MRKHIIATLITGALMGAAGCYDLFTDAQIFHAGGLDEVGGGGGTGGSGGGPGDCVPSVGNPNIHASCGVFVSPLGSDAEGNGSKEKPYLTLGAALSAKEVVAGKPVYACANDQKPFDEALSLSSEVTIYGGLDCANGWAYDPTKKSVWTAPANSVPLSLGAGADVAVYDFAILARDATKDGGSSIGVIATQASELRLERCEVVAGNAKEGSTPEKPPGTGTQGQAGSAGQDGCVDLVSKPGGNPGQNMCEGFSQTGGVGGTGTTIHGGPGGDGLPQPGPTPTDGKGQAGQTDSAVCKLGEPGAQGITGSPADGAQGIGTISAEGYAGKPGADGKDKGTPGQGGGGGGGAKVCATDPNAGFAGPGGGGGGAGGCGGLAGKGGGPGGASIAIVSVGAIVTLTDVTLQTGAGGKGGTGGDGQLGGLGGAGGTAGSNNGDLAAEACNGGKGGKGGDGSPGGGGLGGHSLGIAFQGKPATMTNVKIQLGAPGNGGPGGAMTPAPNAAGAPGKQCRTLDFNAGESSCVQ